MNDDLISRKALIEKVKHSPDTMSRFYVLNLVSSPVYAPAVAAVPVSELIEFRDFVYAADGITMRHLKMLNQLIAKYAEDTRT